MGRESTVVDMLPNVDVREEMGGIGPFQLKRVESVRSRLALRESSRCTHCMVIFLGVREIDVAKCRRVVQSRVCCARCAFRYACSAGVGGRSHLAFNWHPFNVQFMTELDVSSTRTNAPFRPVQDGPFLHVPLTSEKREKEVGTTADVRARTPKPRPSLKRRRMNHASEKRGPGNKERRTMHSSCRRGLCSAGYRHAS